MKFNNINHIIVLGGSVISLSFLKFLKNSKINYHFFTNKRMLDDKISNNRSLREHLKLNKINYTSTQNINTNKKIKTILSAKTLGIGFGQPWVIKKVKTVTVTITIIPTQNRQDHAHSTTVSQ